MNRKALVKSNSRDLAAMRLRGPQQHSIKALGFTVPPAAPEEGGEVQELPELEPE